MQATKPMHTNKLKARRIRSTLGASDPASLLAAGPGAACGCEPSGAAAAVAPGAAVIAVGIVVMLAATGGGAVGASVGTIVPSDKESSKPAVTPSLGVRISRSPRLSTTAVEVTRSRSATVEPFGDLLRTNLERSMTTLVSSCIRRVAIDPVEALQIGRAHV